MNIEHLFDGVNLSSRMEKCHDCGEPIVRMTDNLMGWSHGEHFDLDLDHGSIPELRCITEMTGTPLRSGPNDLRQQERTDRDPTP
jgi:hypothetical protein